MAKITTNTQSKTGAAKTYNVGGKVQSRAKTVKQVAEGKHPGYHEVVINDVSYVRSNPDSSTRNNVDE